MANVMSRALVALLALVVGACSGSPTAPDPVQPGPPVVVNPPTVQETVIDSRPFRLSPCMSPPCYSGGAVTIPALGDGKIRVAITVTEPQSMVVARLWSESTTTNPSPRLIASREILTSRDPSDPSLGNGSKGTAEFEEYDGEVRWLTISNASPIELPGGWVISHAR